MSPATKNPSARPDVTETTVGTDPFTKISLLSDKELPEPAAGNANIALFPAESRMIAPLIKKGFELWYSKSIELSEPCTV